MGRPAKPYGSQVCTKCSRKLPPTEFRRKGRSNPTLRSKCKSCEREIVKEWQRKNKKRYRELQQRWIDKQNAKAGK